MRNFVFTFFYPIGYENMAIKSQHTPNQDKQHFMYKYEGTKNASYLALICSNNFVVTTNV